MTNTNGNNPMQKDCVCMQMHVRMPGLTAKADKSKFDFGEADHKMFSLTKKIVDSDEFRKVRHCVSEMRAFLRARSLPSPMLRDGSYMIPVAIFETVEQRFEEFEAEYKERVDMFLTAYPALKEEAERRLGAALYDVADYPTVESLRAAFGVERAYIELDAPGRLRSVNQAFFEKARAEWDYRFKKASEEAVGLLRAEMKMLVDRMVDQLGVGSNGRKKSFRKTSVKKFTEFLEHFELRNVNSDDELSTLTSTATRLLSGMDLESIKKDDEYRNSVRDTFNVMKERLDKLVVDKPSRAISFDEEV